MPTKPNISESPIQRRIDAILIAITIAIIILIAGSSAHAQSNGDTLRWNGNPGITSWITNSNQWFDVTTNASVSINNGPKQNNNYIFRFDGAVTNGTVAPTTMTITGVNLFSTGINFANNFNATNTVSISSGGAASTITLGSSLGSTATTAVPWTLTNNATSGTVTFTNGGVGPLSFKLFSSGTITVASGGTTSLALPIINFDATRTGGITKQGAGTLILGGANTYTGGTTISGGILQANVNSLVSVGGIITVNNGGTLLLSGAGNHIGDNLTLNLNGGTYNTGGVSENTGILTLTANSILDLAAGSSSVVNFGNVGTNTGTLTVLNWTGTLITGGAGDRLLLSDTINAALLVDNVQFIDPAGLPAGTYFGIVSATNLNEIVPGAPIPEPSTWIGGAFALAAVGFMQRRRLRRLISVRS